MKRQKILTAAIFGAAKSILEKSIYHEHLKERANHRNTLLNVLNRVVLDENFRAALLFSGAKALEPYELNLQEKAALISGDINWIEKNMGQLEPDQKNLIMHRLEAEIW